MGTRSLIGAAITLVVCVLLFVVNATVYQPRRAKLEEMNRELATADSELAYVAGHATHLARIHDFLPKPLESDVANEGEQQFLSRISKKLQESGMVLTRVEPQRVVEDGSYTRRGFKLEVEGGFREFANFLRYLELMPEVVIVESFELHSKEVGRRSKHSETLKLTVIGY